MIDLGVGVGLVLVIEGLLWALAPGLALRLLASAAAMPQQSLRMAGITAMAVGVAVTATGARRFEVDINGRPVTLESELANAAAAHRSIRGKQSERLDAHQRHLRDDDIVDFEIVLKAHPAYPTRPYDGTGLHVPITEFNEALLAHRAENRTQLEALKRDLRSWLDEHGATVTDYENLPIMAVSGPAWMLRDVRLEAEDIESLELAVPTASPLLTHAGHASMNEAALSGPLCGPCDGGGLGVGIWEKGTSEGLSGRYGAIATNNTRLIAAATDTYETAPTPCTTDSQCPPNMSSESYRCSTTLGKCVSEHRSVVAGMIGLQGTYTYPSGVPGVGGVTFAQAGTTNVVRFIVNEWGSTGVNWYMGQPSAYINRSQDGTDAGAASVALNWAARYDNVLLTVAAGNSGTESVANSLFINAISVGGFRYETWNSPSTHRRNSVYSSYINNNSVYPGLERPNLLGPMSHLDGGGLYAGLSIPLVTAAGTPAMTLTTLNGSQAVGTSLAAPAVLSVAMAAHQYAGLFSALYFPVTRKAVVMAATRDSNADGMVAKGNAWSSTPDGEDGAGHPDLAYVKSLLDAGNNFYTVLDDSAFTSCGPGCRTYPLATVNVGFRGRIKAALVWTACAPTASAPTTQPPTDFDLAIIRPAFCGGSTAQSVSVNNEVEMLYDDCLPVGGAPRGTYQYSFEIRIKNGASISTACGTSEPIGFAWSVQ